MVKYILFIPLWMMIACGPSSEDFLNKEIAVMTKKVEQRVTPKLKKQLVSLLKKHPKNPDLLWLAGEVNYIYLDYSQAMKFFRLSIKENPHLIKGWKRLLKLYQRNGEKFPYFGAIKTLMRLEPTNWEWPYRAAIHYNSFQQHNKGLNALKKADTLKPNYPPILIWRLKIVRSFYQALPEKKWRGLPLSQEKRAQETVRLKALFMKTIDKLRKISPKDPLHQELLFDFLMITNQCDQGAKELPNNQLETLKIVAGCYHQKGENQQAAKWLEKGFSKYPQKTNLISKIAALYEKSTPAKSIHFYQISYTITRNVHNLINLVKVMITQRYPKEKITPYIEQIKALTGHKEEIIIKSLEKKVKNMK